MKNEQRSVSSLMPSSQL